MSNWSATHNSPALVKLTLISGGKGIGKQNNIHELTWVQLNNPNKKYDHRRCSDSMLACARSPSTTLIYQHNRTPACRMTCTLWWAKGLDGLFPPRQSHHCQCQLNRHRCCHSTWHCSEGRHGFQNLLEESRSVQDQRQTFIWTWSSVWSLEGTNLLVTRARLCSDAL